MESVPTRLLILSDTHGHPFPPSDRPSQRADVTIHCGDLTDGSTLSEFHTTIALLKAINAPLKLAIAGNHDFALDTAAFARKCMEATPKLEPDLVEKVYGASGAVRELFEEAARDAGIMLLDEGTHHFHLANGAQLTVYASPYTPSIGGEWGFQYNPSNGHDFSQMEGADIAITHGPPRGVLDISHGRERAGCPDLFAAVARARPRVHCFGHIHEGWGARVVGWRDGGAERPMHFTAIDNERSHLIERLASLRPGKFDTEEDAECKAVKLRRLEEERCYATSHLAGDEFPVEYGTDTLFVNAAVSGDGDAVQRPWLVDIELPKANKNKDIAPAV